MLLCIQVLIVSGLSLFLSSLSVYVRDVIQVLGVALQVVFYTSTILYPLNAVPGKLKYIVLLNPMTALAEAYHKTILYDSFPDYKGFLYLIVVMIASVTAGIFVFRKLKKGFADVL
jgi:lipopolysaccharide transport system permease protein